MTNKFGKLILRLSSDYDGEVVAAARLLIKALKKDGKDLHWLAEKADSQSMEMLTERIKKTWAAQAAIDIDGMINYVELYGHDYIRKKDYDFVIDLANQMEANNGYATKAQIKYLKDLYKKVLRARGG